MAYESTKMAEYNEAEKVIIFAMGQDQYGLLYDDKPKVLEIYIDHNFNGNGCGNLILDGFGKTLDLEFCRSENL